MLVTVKSFHFDYKMSKYNTGPVENGQIEEETER